MRIAHLAWESMHSIRVGGLATVVTKLAEEQAKHGHEVHVFTRWAEGQTEYEFINGVDYHRCRFDPGGNMLALSYNMSKAMATNIYEVERYRGRFDIIHGHDWHVVDALSFLKQGGRPVVLTFHSTEYGRNGGRFGDWWEYGEISGKEWYGGYLANRVTTVSHATRNELSWLYKMPTDKIDVIPNAVEPREYQLWIEPGRIKEKYGIHPLAPTVLFVGRVDYQKGPDMLAEAMPKVIGNRWDAKVIFAGDGGMRGHVENIVNGLGVGHAARFPGWIPFYEHLELLNACDVVCIPSRNEPFGIVLLEAWSTGKPVVATDVGGLGENIENFVDGVKVYTNPDSIAWGINYLINNPEESKRVANGGREKVKQFDWGKALDKLMNTYQAALGEQPK